MTKKTATFKMDDNLIFSLISRQAGSVQKSIAELISNSFDSQSSRVNVSISTNGFVVADDGIGFRSETEINDWFATIGFDHQASELHNNSSRYGTFGMGRMQCFSFARTQWQTNQFKMDVDIKANGLNFDLSTTDTHVKGCQIQGTWYEKKSLSEVKTIVSELSKMVTYFPIPVVINGNNIVKQMKWDQETAHVCLSRKEHGGLEIYSQGVFVCTLPAYVYGSGIAVSKTPMMLNMARNEVIENQCPVFKEIKAFLKQDATRLATQSTRLDDDARAMLLQTYIDTGDSNIESKLLIKTVTNRHYSISKILSSNITMRPPNVSKIIAERVQHDNVLVLEPVVLEWAQCETLHELITALKSNDPYRRKPTIIEFEDLAKGISNSHVILKPKELTRTETVMLKSMQCGFSEFSYSVHGYLYRAGYTDKEYQLRKLYIGKSDTAEAWTDAHTYICIDRDVVNNCSKNGWRSLHRLIMLILHELLHTQSNLTDNIHDHAFYEHFHNCVLDNYQGLFFYLRKATAGYISNCRKHNITLSKKDLADFQKEIDIGEVLNNPDGEFLLGED